MLSLVIGGDSDGWVDLHQLAVRQRLQEVRLSHEFDHGLLLPFLGGSDHFNVSLLVYGDENAISQGLHLRSAECVLREQRGRIVTEARTSLL